MQHVLTIGVSKEPQTRGIVKCRNITMREKLLTRFLGQKCNVMVLVPGHSVSTLTIKEEGGCDENE